MLRQSCAGNLRWIRNHSPLSVKVRSEAATAPRPRPPWPRYASSRALNPTWRSHFSLSIGLAAAVGLASIWWVHGDGPTALNDTPPQLIESDGSLRARTRPTSLLVSPADLIKEDSTGPLVRPETRPPSKLEVLDLDGIDTLLRNGQTSYSIPRGHGVRRVDVSQLASNDPVEDAHAEAMVAAPQSTTDYWMLFGIYDGHNGWTTAQKLRRSLFAHVYRELEAVKIRADHVGDREWVDRAVKRAFLALDHDLVWNASQTALRDRSRAGALPLLSPAYSGACSLLGIYDTDSRRLHVAGAGDSRAVMGRRADDGHWTAVALSVDQNGDNPEEQARIRAEHPGEEEAVCNGRVLGQFQPSRAFGDAAVKLPRDVSLRLCQFYCCHRPGDMVQTPPYLTAEPEMTTTQIEPAKGDFVVMASRGLWECLSNEQVVGLVGLWLHEQQGTGLSPTPTSAGWFSRAWSTLFSSSATALPLSLSMDSSTTQKTPRPAQWGRASAKDRFVVQDENVATHLLRNALGGCDQDLVASLLMLPSPTCRRFRDDITITVILFEE